MEQVYSVYLMYMVFAVKIAVIAVVYSTILVAPGNILSRWKSWLDWRLNRKNSDGQDHAEEKAQQRRHFTCDVSGKCCSGGVEPIRQCGVVHFPGFVDLLFLLIREHDLRVVHLHIADVLLLDHLHKGAVVYLLHLVSLQQRCNDHIKNQYDQQNDAVVVDQGLFW